MNRRQSLPVALRSAIRKSPLSAYELSKRSGVSDSVLSRFLNRKQGITLDTAERLARVLHLALT